jgi:hypothetical protein
VHVDPQRAPESGLSKIQHEMLSHHAINQKSATLFANVRLGGMGVGDKDAMTAPAKGVLRANWRRKSLL